MKHYQSQAEHGYGSRDNRSESRHRSFAEAPNIWGTASSHSPSSPYRESAPTGRATSSATAHSPEACPKNLRSPRVVVSEASGAKGASHPTILPRHNTVGRPGRRSSVANAQNCAVAPSPQEAAAIQRARALADPSVTLSAPVNPQALAAHAASKPSATAVAAAAPHWAAERGAAPPATTSARSVPAVYTRSADAIAGRARAAAHCFGRRDPSGSRHCAPDAAPPQCPAITSERQHDTCRFHHREQWCCVPSPSAIRHPPTAAFSWASSRPHQSRSGGQPNTFIQPAALCIDTQQGRAYVWITGMESPVMLCVLMTPAS